MEPRIQYAKTSDGVNIAYAVAGEGPPLLAAWGWTNVQREWQFPEIRSFYERLAAGRQLIRYDHRGVGLSDRNITDYSLEALVRDLEAVVDHVGLERLALVAAGYSGLAAVVYAVRHPERVSHLILWCAWTRTSSEVASSTRIRGLTALRSKDWELWSEADAYLQTGWSAGDAGHRLAAFIRENVTPEGLQALMQAVGKFDVGELLPHVKAPTLVLHRRQVYTPGAEAARELAAGIPGARLALLDGEAWLPFLGDSEASLAAIEGFLGEAEAAERRAPSGLVTILFTDIESSTALTQRLGDQQAQELVREHDRIVREALKAHGGSEIKHTGDGIMASFSTASAALNCAVAIQAGVQASSEALLRVHIGLNAGEPVAEGGDLFGSTVQLARRICDHARGGEIVVANVVRELAAGKGLTFADLGLVTLKGFGEPVRLFELLWREGMARRRAYPDGLTEREVQVLRLVAAGRSNSEIADELVLSLRTVERHITNIYGKINAHGKADATRYALDHGLTGSST